MNDLSFRLAHMAEADLVQAISARAYIPAYESVIGAAPKPAYEDYRPRIEKLQVWIAELEGEPVGILILEDELNHTLVYSIAVEPIHQGKGFAKAILRQAEQIARSQSKSELRLYTNMKMHSNIRLYLSCGFTEFERRPHPSRSGEFLVDMKKRIDSRL